MSGTLVNVMELSPTPGSSLGYLGGADSGLSVTQDAGATWHPRNDVSRLADVHVAALLPHPTLASRAWALVGTSGTAGGALLETLDSGASWHSVSATQTEVYGVGTSVKGLLTPGEHPRSTGHLLAIDPTSRSGASFGYIYVGTFDEGVWRGVIGDPGAGGGISSWTLIGLAPTRDAITNAKTAAYYIRTLERDPLTATLYASTYVNSTATAPSPQSGRVWRCPQPHGTSPAFTQLTGSPRCVEDLRMVRDTLFGVAHNPDVAAERGGFYLQTPDSIAAATAWTKIAELPVASQSGSANDPDGWKCMDAVDFGQVIAFWLGCTDPAANAPGSGSFPDVFRLDAQPGTTPTGTGTPSASVVTDAPQYNDPLYETGTAIATADKEAGRINSIVIIGNVAYVGGNYREIKTSVGDPRGSNVVVNQSYLSAWDLTTGNLLNWDPQVNGRVFKILPSPDGSRLYIGGQFTTAGGSTHSRLIAASPNTSLSGSAAIMSSPTHNIGGAIWTIAVAGTGIGSALFIGGQFTAINSDSSWMRLAKLNPNGWALDANWKPQAKAASGPNDVRAMILDPARNAVVVAGWFDQVAPDAGAPFDLNQKYITRLSQIDGSIMAWANHGAYTSGANSYPACEVIGLAGPDANGQIYAAQGGSGGRASAFRLSDGARMWTYWTNGNCQAVGLAGNMVIVGHHGDNVASVKDLAIADAPGGGPVRHKVFMLDKNGVLQAWAPDLGSNQTPTSPDYGGVLGVFAIAGRTDGTVIVGGDFTQVGGASRHRLAYFPGSGGGTTTAWTFTPRTAAGETLPGFPANFTLDVKNEVGGPGGPHSWIYDSLVGEFMGKAGGVATHITIDPEDATHIYVCGQHELYYSPDAGESWYPYTRGHGAVTVNRVAVNPRAAGQALLGADQFGVLLASQSGDSVKRINPAGASVHARALMIDDPGSGPVTVLAGISSDPNASPVVADVWENLDPFGAGGWTSLTGGTGFATFGGIIMGGISVRRADTTRVVVVAIRNVGLFQKTGGAAFTRIADTQFTPTGAVMLNQVTALANFTNRPGSSNVYLLDRATGVWRGANYGVGPWVRILNLSIPDNYRGSLRAHPTNDAIVFVGTSTQILRITNADTAGSSGATTVNITGAVPNPGPLALDTSRVRVASIVAPGQPAKFYEATLADATSGTPPTWTAQDDAYYPQAAPWARSLAFDSNLTDYVGTEGFGLVIGLSSTVTPPAPAGSATYIMAGEAGGGGLAATTAVIQDYHDNNKADGFFALGDLAYNCGSDADYAANYATHWGLYDKKSTLQWIWPTTGPRDWGPNAVAGLSCTNPSLQGYDTHFSGAGMLFNDPGITRSATVGSEAGYFYYRDIPGTNWRHISLVGVPKAGATRLVVDGVLGSEQYNWLVAVLQDAQQQNLNIIATWSSPRFATSSTADGTTIAQKDEQRVAPFWDTLYQYAAGKCVIVNAGAHNYERFVPLKPDGTQSPDGLVEFVVGTGGQTLWPALGARRARSAYFNAQDTGVLRLTLRQTGIDWQFVSTAAAPTNTDSGSLELPGAQSTGPTQLSVTPTDTGHLAVETATVVVSASGQQQFSVVEQGVLSKETVAVNTGGKGVPFTNTIYMGAGDYFAKDDRVAALGHYAEGVRSDRGQDPRNALLVVPHAPAGLSVDVGVGWGLVQGDDIQNQGAYLDFNDAPVTVTIPSGSPPPATSGVNRIDAIVAKVNDSEAKVVPTGEPADQMFFQWVVGNPTAGVTLSSPGASPPAIPPTALLLAWVEVDNGATTITSGKILDKRKLYGPLLLGADGNSYRLAISSQGVLQVEQVA